MKLRLRILSIIFLLFLLPVAMTAQVTSSSITGTVKSASGEKLSGSTIKLVHVPTGTTFKTTSNKDGRFDLVNLIAGGPYAIEISYVGYFNFSTKEANLPLGENTNLDAILNPTSTNLANVVVIGTKSGIDARKKTGAATNISKAQIAALPTLSRSLTDYTRLTPQANGNSFGGMSNRFNNITIDGAVNNDVFGLAGSGTPGGQAGTSPISLDAIQEIQVVLAPYDVSYGNFTGGGVNAITRSGTNNFEGSIYKFLRNENTIGKDPVSNIKSGAFTDEQYGLRLGGAIVKNKLFFFGSGELARKTAPTTYNAGDLGAAITIADAKRIADTLKTKYGYDAGTIGAYSAATQSDKLFGRIDWNISDKHRFTIRHNYIKAFDDNISRSNTTFRFGNNTYRFNNTQNITVAELRSRFSATFSNNLIVGRHQIRDFRSTYGSLFPSIEIANAAATYTAGSERSSTANELDQDIIEVTDNAKLFKGKHTITIGTHNEFFSFRNLFINNLNGRWRFGSLNEFYSNSPKNFDVTYSANKTADARPSAKFNAAQLGFYVQDEIQFNQNFRLTYGLRVDMPIINNKPGYNKIVDSSFEGAYNTQNIPNKQLLWAPRVGFNYDVEGDRKVIIRGGVGLFTGRVPFVWISNQFSNTGLLLSTTSQTDATPTVAPYTVNNGAGFNPNVSQQSSVGTANGTSFEADLITKNFKLPQVLRVNLATDVKLPGEVNLTLEAIVSSTINNVQYQDVNLKAPVGLVDTAYNKGFDTRIAYGSTTTLRRLNNNITNALLISNTNKGYSLNVGATVNKTWKHFFGQIAYNYNSAADLNSGASSTALSNWSFVQVVGNPNDPQLATSNYQLKHRITGIFSMMFDYAKHFKTSLSFFYNGNSGSPFTYLVNGDLNSDGNTGNDLLYVPTDATQIKFVDFKVGSTVKYTAAEQAAAFQNFIDGDSYLSSKRGKYVERNGRSTPWENVVDARLTQDFYVKFEGKQHDLQLTLDVFNLTNLINKDWGRQYSVANQAYSLLTVVTSPAKGYNYNIAQPIPWGVNFGSRWQGQIGLRYTFN